MTIALATTSTGNALGGNFAAARDALPGNDGVFERRQTAFDDFAKRGLPTRRIEDWKYTDLRTLLKEVAPLATANYPRPLDRVEQETTGVIATLPSDARILGWDSAALVMPSHGVLVAAFPRPMPLSPSDSARQTDYRRFFARGTAFCTRLAIARRWDATHIAYLTDELKRSVQSELTAFGPAASPSAQWRLIRVPPRDATTC
jgi:hypothetical protein